MLLILIEQVSAELPQVTLIGGSNLELWAPSVWDLLKLFLATRIQPLIYLVLSVEYVRTLVRI